MKIFGLKQYLKDRYNLKADELKKLSLLFFYSFCLGLFIAFYFVPANSEFVKYFGNKELPYAYILSGIVGFIITLIYSNVQKKKASKILFILALLIMLGIALLSRLLLLFLELNEGIISAYQYEIIKKWLSFFVFIWAWPFIALVATITGGLALRLLNLIQVKKFFGIINIGGVLAATISYFTIPVLLRATTHHYDLFLIGSTGLIAAVIIIITIYKRFPEEKIKTAKKTQLVETINSKYKIKDSLKKILKKNFFYLIFISAIFSTIAIYISDYGFLLTIKEQKEIFQTPEDVAKFIALVFGFLKIGEFLISIFSGRILSRGGLKVGLIVLPISITILILLAFLSGKFVGVASIVFLIIITLNKSIERVFRRGIDDPAFNVLYQTLPDDRKLFVQTRVGVVQQLSIAIAGLLLLLINTIISNKSGFNLNAYLLYVLPFLLIWVFIAIRLYKAYKIRIRQILSEKKLFELEYKEKNIFATDILQKHILSEDINSAKFSVVILSETNPRSLENYANFLLKVDDTIIRKSILKNIDATYSLKLIHTIEKVGNEIGFKEKELRKLILRSLYNLDYSDVKPHSFQELLLLSKTDKSRDKIFLAKYLYKHVVVQDEQIISELLDNEEKVIKLAAIKIASKRRSEFLHDKLISLLQSPEYNNILVNILIEIGDNILEELNTFYKKQTDTSILLKVIQIFAKIGTYRAKQYLISYINYPVREIQTAVINALYYSEYRVNGDTVATIKQKVKDVVENILWIYVSIKDIVNEKNTLKLIQSLDLERENSFDVLFILLSFIHPPETVELIRTNIVGENTIYALELIDNFISPDLKTIIIPLFEKISLGHKIKKLRPFFYHKVIGFENRLKDILLKDFKKVDIWSKTKALELIGKNLRNNTLNNKNNNSDNNSLSPKTWSEIEANRILQKINKEQLPDELFVCLYHPAEIIYSTAAKVIYEQSPILCENYLRMISPEKSKLIPILRDNEDLLIDKIKLLKRVFLFYTIPEKSLLKLSKIVRFKKKKKNDYIYFNIEDRHEDIIIIIKGKLIYKNKAGESYEYKRNDVIIKGLNIPQKATKLKSTKNIYVIFINRFEFFNLLVTDTELIHHLFNRMKF